MIGVTVLLVAWDIYADIVGGTKSTISVVLFDAARNHPIIPFVLGVLVGHVMAPVQ